MKKKSLLFVLMVLLFSFIILPDNANANEELDYFTVEGYEAYLEELISTNSESSKLASKGLVKFKALDTADKETFLKFLKSNEYTDVLTEALIEANDKDFTVKIDDIEVPVNVEVSKSPGKASIVPFSTGSYNTTVVCSYRLYTFGIHTTTLRTTVVFNGDGFKAVKSLDVYHGHENINPGVWITYNTSNHYIDGLYAYGRASYELRATPSLGFIAVTVTHTVRARWSGHVQHKLDSLHPKIKSFSWRDC
ncbi:hypothetical protein NXZ75_10675 [Lysinibacillus sphaericus]|uniref:hypothetical protein n=1 Tax=Lysinibacillus sphaericus TaxID=1421 RepID=UPI002162261B|nr:hypothetical protein [Lysinibacillus sphaericus]MCS1382657.1 hypothetical protein [Lysinibacillus sphaericus]